MFRDAWFSAFWNKYLSLAKLKHPILRESMIINVWLKVTRWTNESFLFGGIYTHRVDFSWFYCIDKDRIVLLYLMLIITISTEIAYCAMPTRVHPSTSGPYLCCCLTLGSAEHLIVIVLLLVCCWAFIHTVNLILLASLYSTLIFCQHLSTLSRLLSSIKE